jgi:hypothetical protein
MIGGERLYDVNGSGAITVIAVSSSYYSTSFRLDTGKYFAISYQVGTNTPSRTNWYFPSVTLQLEQSWTEPAVEGSADSNWTVPTSLADIHTTLNDSALKITAFSPVALKYGRLKVNSAAASPTNTAITARVHIFEDYT